MRPSILGFALLAASSLSTPSSAQAQVEDHVPVEAEDSLADAFADPPAEARPRVWWHWLSGNVSEEGITKDLEWMQRIGIAGAMMFDGDMGAPKIVPERVTVLSPAWYDKLHFAASEAARLDLEFAMAAAPGWSETGGPWVPPEAAMKKLVWSETRVSGGQRAGRLAPLPSNAGPFQTIAKSDALSSTEAGPLTMARDIAVLAYPAPQGDVPLPALQPVVTTSAEGVDARKFLDGDLQEHVTLPNPVPDAPQWVRYDFTVPRTLRALTYVGPLGGRFADGPDGRIEASDDGTNWKTVRTLVGPAHNPAPQCTFAFPATTARYFRVLFDRPLNSREPFPAPDGMMLAELAFVPGARVDMFEDKAGFGVLSQEDQSPTPSISAASAIRSSDIIDLSDRLRPDGTLEWIAPPGEWIVLRTGWSLTGQVNHPATPEGTGLEVDKLDAEAVRGHLDAYLDPVIRHLGALSGERGLSYLLTDSWEAGQENWTGQMPAQFRKRRGYDLTNLLPVLTGRVVDSAAKSDAFLWDYRKTLADLVAENHYGTITRFAEDHGLGYYGEATGAAWPTVADGMLAKSRTDIPMGEFWAIPFGGQPAAYHHVRSDEFPADIIETRSTAHVYGKPVVAAEAFTSSLPQWISTPWQLKWVADRYFALGVNRMVIHTSPHQPDDTRRPGLTLGPFGQAFTRHETWAEMAKPWIDYLARNSFMLQQGVPVADVLYFYGEGAPVGVPYDRAGEPADLREFGFDYVNADALMRLARVEDGTIVFPGGASYRVLVLPRHMSQMTLPMIARLRDLVAQGAVIVGPRPAGSPSLASAGSAVRSVADELWGETDGETRTRNEFGKGRVYWRDDVREVLAEEGVMPDFAWSPTDANLDLRFIHRRTAEGDIYFVTNQSASAGSVPLRFRISGKQPELWNPADASMRPLGYRQRGSVTEVPLRFDAYGSALIVFRAPATCASRVIAEPPEDTIKSLDTGWILSVPVKDGAPVVRQVSAGSWTQDSAPDVRYFSGTATYTRDLDMPKVDGRDRLYLDLGTVADIAEVRINGEPVATAWKPPYRVDITEAVHAGHNRLDVRVANTWQNRMVGDLQPDAAPQTWVNDLGAFPPMGGELRADTPLRPAGLLGPVRLVRERAAQGSGSAMGPESCD
ncbi:glycosyl hydrolase [uncultured Croceicoccus sp.]|uniref:glycosyl hydrolase n=1 Tax=uncultured Croceicoccus sp. TaxID=1295329 RepID=UPI002630B470|nr:glycosyl hydrolase [uncultured Croceicoccus sp.]